MVMEKKYYTIGEMARIVNMTPKTLRYYDDQKLLVPEWRNPKTGYRQYSEKQLLKAIIISDMKKHSLSLKEINDVLNKGDLSLLKRIMDDKITIMKKEIISKQRQLATTEFAYGEIKVGLDALEKRNQVDDSERELKYKMVIREYPPLVVVFTRYHSAIKNGGLFCDRYLELKKICEKKGYGITGSFHAVFHDHYMNQFLFDAGDLEVFFPIMLSDDVPLSKLPDRSNLRV